VSTNKPLVISDVVVKTAGFYSNGCTKHVVQWNSDGVRKRKFFRKSYSAESFAKQLTYKPL
jgi:hypothetical protein